jgi:hypothetical protein
MRWKGPLSPSGANGPIARPANPRSTPPSPGRASANPGRLGARLPERRLSRAARQLGKPCRELWAPGARSRELLVLVLADPEVSLRAGSPSLATWEISSAAGRPAQELEGASFKILWDGSDHPQNRPRYPQAEACYPPVLHRFIHRRAQRRGRGPASTELDSTGRAGTGRAGRLRPRSLRRGVRAWRTWDQSSEGPTAPPRSHRPHWKSMHGHRGLGTYDLHSQSLKVTKLRARTAADRCTRSCMSDVFSPGCLLVTAFRRRAPRHGGRRSPRTATGSTDRRCLEHRRWPRRPRRLPDLRTGSAPRAGPGTRSRRDIGQSRGSPGRRQ